MLFGVIGFAVGPSAPEDSNPGPGENANGVRVIAATLSSLGVDVRCPGALVSGVVGEAGQRRA
jgi:hypothetical protein